MTANSDLARKLLSAIDELAAQIDRPLRFMEVCGTHTVAIFRSGLRQALPPKVELVSGPGCPVCVTADEYLDKAIAYAKQPNVIIATFGDMLKVPGSSSSLGEAKAEGGDIRIVYSPLDSLDIAKANPQKKVIFLAVGFETTAPTVAATVLAAAEARQKNLFFLSAHKLVPPAIKMLLEDPLVKVDGFILPGHVAVVTGTGPFAFLAEEYKLPGVVTGFEPVQILRSLYRLLQQTAAKQPAILNEYGSVVQEEGNPYSRQILAQVYKKAPAFWRGIGELAESGLTLKEEFASFDIEKVWPLTLEPAKKQTACRCGDILKGIADPRSCPLFAKVCTPAHAVGPCMVSVEGVCAAWYKYGQEMFKA